MLVVSRLTEVLVLGVMDLSHESLGRNLVSSTRREEAGGESDLALEAGREVAYLSLMAGLEGYWVPGLPLVSDLGYEAPLALHLVLHSLQPAVRQSYVVAAPPVTQAVLALLVTKPGEVLGSLHSVLELVGRTLLSNISVVLELW